MLSASILLDNVERTEEWSPVLDVLDFPQSSYEFLFMKGANSFFIRTLLDKKYALPYKVLDGLVQHFMRFEDEERLLPVVWHHALLAFAQRYKYDIKDDEKAQLKRLLKSQYHAQVTPEIHRELDQVLAKSESAANVVSDRGNKMETD